MADEPKAADEPKPDIDQPDPWAVAVASGTAPKPKAKEEGNSWGEFRPGEAEPLPEDLEARSKSGKKKGWGDKKAMPSGPNLARTRVTESKVKGQVMEWKGKYGWIMPQVPVKHPKAYKHQGKIYVSYTDLASGCRQLYPGTICEFFVFEDEAGIGAEEVTAVQETTSWKGGGKWGAASIGGGKAQSGGSSGSKGKGGRGKGGGSKGDFKGDGGFKGGFKGTSKGASKGFSADPPAPDFSGPVPTDWSSFKAGGGAGPSQPQGGPAFGPGSFLTGGRGAGAASTGPKGKGRGDVGRGGQKGFADQGGGSGKAGAKGGQKGFLDSGKGGSKGGKSPAPLGQMPQPQLGKGAGGFPMPQPQFGKGANADLGAPLMPPQPFMGGFSQMAPPQMSYGKGDAGGMPQMVGAPDGGLYAGGMPQSMPPNPFMSQGAFPDQSTMPGSFRLSPDPRSLPDPNMGSSLFADPSMGMQPMAPMPQWDDPNMQALLAASAPGGVVGPSYGYAQPGSSPPAPMLGGFGPML